MGLFYYFESARLQGVQEVGSVENYEVRGHDDTAGISQNMQKGLTQRFPFICKFRDKLLIQDLYFKYY